MFHALLRTALPICLTAALAACGGGGSGSLPLAAPSSPTTPTTVSARLDAAGGTLAGPDGVTVTVPPGALSAATTITVTETSAGAPSGLPQGSNSVFAQSKVFEFTPHDVQFAKPVTIRIPVDTSRGTPRVYVSDLSTGWYPQASTAGNGYVEIQRTGFSWIYVLIPLSVSATVNDINLDAASVAALDITSPRSMKLMDTDRGLAGALHDVLYGVATVQVEALQGQAASALFGVRTYTDANPNTHSCQASQMALDILVGSTWMPLNQFMVSSKTRQAVPHSDSAYFDTSNFNVSFTPALLGTFDLRVRTICDNAADLKAIDPRLADASWKIRMKVSSSYTLGGTVGGLPNGGSVKVALNGDTAQTVSANGAFTVATRLGSGDNYAITTTDAPAGYTCTLTNAGGSIANADVSNVGVSCGPTPYSLTGNVTGLPQGASVTLLLNGADGQTVSNPSGSADDFLPFTLATQVVPGQSYAVTVGTVSPSGYACTVSGGSGTMPANAVDGIVVNCTPAGPFTLGGTASGLDAGGPYPSMVLTRDGDSANTTTVPLTGNGAYSLGNVPGGTAYYVSVDTTGTGYSCIMANRSGGATANVGNIDVSCSASAPSGPPLPPSP